MLVGFVFPAPSTVTHRQGEITIGGKGRQLSSAKGNYPFILRPIDYRCSIDLHVQHDDEEKHKLGLVFAFK